MHLAVAAHWSVECVGSKGKRDQTEVESNGFEREKASIGKLRANVDREIPGASESERKGRRREKWVKANGQSEREGM